MKTLTYRPSKEQDNIIVSIAELARQNNRSLNSYIELLFIDHIKQSACKPHALVNKVHAVVEHQDEQQTTKLLSLPEWIAAKTSIESWDELAISKWKNDLSNADYLSQKQKDLILKSS